MNERLSQATRNHYQELIGQIGAGYIDYRWQRHPVSRSHYRQTRKAVEFAFRGIEPAGELLEIGCGPGTWTDICLAHGARLTIVDISSEMLKLVRERFSEAPLDLHCGDFLNDGVEIPRRFDVIFSARALEYMDDKEAMVAKSVRWLSPGGRLVVITKNPGWVDKHREDRRGAADTIHSGWIDWRTLEGHYRRHGLRDVVTYPVCLGSYYRPLSMAPAIRFCDLLQAGLHRHALRPGFDFLVESYMTIGRKPPTQGDAP